VTVLAGPQYAVTNSHPSAIHSSSVALIFSVSTHVHLCSCPCAIGPDTRRRCLTREESPAVVHPDRIAAALAVKPDWRRPRRRSSRRIPPSAAGARKGTDPARARRFVAGLDLLKLDSRSSFADLPDKAKVRLLITQAEFLSVQRTNQGFRWSLPEYASTSARADRPAHRTV
jgi:hypothetical protein